MSNAKDIGNDLKLILVILDATDVKELELLCDRLKEKNNTIAIIASNSEGRAHIMVAINPNILKQFKKLSAGSIVKQLSELVDGKGGGRPDFARGGGTSIDKLAGALSKAENIIHTMI